MWKKNYALDFSYYFVYHRDTHTGRNYANREKINNRLKARQFQLTWRLIHDSGENL